MRPRVQPAILVVDDDPAVRKLLEFALRQEQFSVHLASGMAEALDKIRNAAIDFVLMDVRMPDGDGPQTLDAIRQINPKVPCCFISGDSGGYSRDDLIRRGAIQIFSKPLDLSSLIQTIRHHLDSQP